MKIKIGIYAGLVLLSSCTEKVKQPNIIFLLTDDQRWDALGVNGNKILETPNIDKLAHDGVNFRNAFVTSSICCISRASILSGQFASQHHILGFRTALTENQIQDTYPLLLKKNEGYKIGFIGKYGIGNPATFPDSLFDYWACDYEHQPHYEHKDSLGRYIHYTSLVKQRIQTFINEYVDDKPFCLSVSFKAPHVEDSDPRQFIPDPKYNDRYCKDSVPRNLIMDEKSWQQYPESFRGNNIARVRWNMRFNTEEKYQESVKNYYRLINGVDDVVGDLRKWLSHKKLDKNTIIIYMGDNGMFLGEHGMAGKWYPYNESVRVPMIMYNPMSKEKGVTIDQIALNIDIAPTILELAGVTKPKHMQGESLLGLLDERKKEWRSGFFYEHNFNHPKIPKSEAYIDVHYKYIVYPELGYEEFYDLNTDSLELNNLVTTDEENTSLKRYRALFAKEKRKVLQGADKN